MLYIRPAFIVLVVLGAIGAGLLIAEQVVRIKANTSATLRDVKDAKERLTQVEKALAELRSGQRQTQGALERIEGRFSRPDQPQLEVGVVRIDRGEAELIRSVVFDEPGAKPEMSVGARLGAAVQDVSPRPVPTALMTQFPKLRGLRYVIDSNWAIALIAPKEDRVVAVIPPI